MRKRTVICLAVLILSPIWLYRDPGSSSISNLRAGVLPVLAQAQNPERDSDVGSIQPDPTAVEQAKARSRFHYLVLGYGAIWLCLGVFLIDLTRRIGRVGSDIEELSARLETMERGKRV